MLCNFRTTIVLKCLDHIVVSIIVCDSMLIDAILRNDSRVFCWHVKTEYHLFSIVVKPTIEAIALVSWVCILFYIFIISVKCVFDCRSIKAILENYMVLILGELRIHSGIFRWHVKAECHLITSLVSPTVESVTCFLCRISRLFHLSIELIRCIFYNLINHNMQVILHTRGVIHSLIVLILSNRTYLRIPTLELIFILFSRCSAWLIAIWSCSVSQCVLTQHLTVIIQETNLERVDREVRFEFHIALCHRIERCSSNLRQTLRFPIQEVMIFSRSGRNCYVVATIYSFTIEGCRTHRSVVDRHRRSEHLFLKICLERSVLSYREGTSSICNTIIPFFKFVTSIWNSRNCCVISVHTCSRSFYFSFLCTIFFSVFNRYTNIKLIFCKISIEFFTFFNFKSIWVRKNLNIIAHSSPITESVAIMRHSLNYSIFIVTARFRNNSGGTHCLICYASLNYDIREPPFNRIQFYSCNFCIITSSFSIFWNTRNKHS